MDTKILEQLASLVLPKEILERFEIVKIETDERDIDAMSMTIHLDERMNRAYQESEESSANITIIAEVTKRIVEILTLPGGTACP